LTTRCDRVSDRLLATRRVALNICIDPKPRSSIRLGVADPLTPIERRVYHYLLDFLAENTYQPSVREIGKRFRIKSTKTVSDLLQSLSDKGYIERDPSRSRGVRLLGYAAAGRTQPVPIFGKIAASEPALLPE